MKPLPRAAKSALHPVKTVVQGGFERLWAGGFAVLGRRRRPRAELWSSGGGHRVLVVATHPDDEVAGCAGTILLHRRRGDRVLVVFVTDGRGSSAYGLSPDEMAATRRREARASMRTLGAEEAWLALPERAWQRDELESALREVLARFQPEIVYAPSRIDFHPEHERVARVIAPVLEDPVVRIFPAQVPLTPALCNLIAPVHGEIDAVAAALHGYESQLGALLRCLRHRRYLGRLYAQPGPVEEFWEMSAEQYRRLHAGRPPRPLTRTFRGLRYYAWSDPLAYLRAQRERRRLAALAGAAP